MWKWDTLSKANLDSVYMGTALLYAKQSKATRAKVGAVLVTKTGVVIPGYNGTPIGTDNTCEDVDNVTLPETIHAETNCVLKAAREGISVVDSVLYVTLAPCQTCAAMLLQAGVSKIVFREFYRNSLGLNYLRKYGKEVIQYDPIEN